MIKRRIYMDYAASAPELPEVRRAQARAARFFGNPSSIHKDGIRAGTLLLDSRKKIAGALGAHVDEIIFVGSGTESDNLAVMGIFKYARLSEEFKGKDVHIITVATEHPAILESCKHLESVGAKITYLSVGSGGLIDLKELRAALRPETILVSIAYANNEIGVVQPIREIAKEIRHYKKSLVGDPHLRAYPYFHSDACQAAQYLPMNVEELGVDLLSLNGTKLGGPHGIALTYIRRGTKIAPMLYGGAQEGGLRSGTENLSGIAGLAAALTETSHAKEKEAERLMALREFFIATLRKNFPECRINGSEEYRLPNNVHVSFKNISGELLVLELDALGISASAGSACSSAKEEPSHVLEALYGSGDDKKWGSARFSMGRTTTKKDISAVISALSHIQKKYKPWHK